VKKLSKKDGTLSSAKKTEKKTLLRGVDSREKRGKKTGSVVKDSVDTRYRGWEEGGETRGILNGDGRAQDVKDPSDIEEGRLEKIKGVKTEELKTLRERRERKKSLQACR